TRTRHINIQRLNPSVRTLLGSNYSSSKEDLALQAVQTRFQKVKAECGQICITEQAKTNVIGKGWYNIVRKPFSCKKIFNYDVFDSSTELEESPHKIPAFLYDEFTYQGRVHVSNMFRNDETPFSKYADWNKDMVQNLVTKIRHGIPTSSYGAKAYSSLKLAMHHTKNTGAHVLVIGSQKPWVEAMLLEQGASHVSTLDYSSIKCDHPQITTYTPPELTAAFLSGTLPVFDGVVSYSSIEHSGLGRYGDALNPYGDLIAMARAWCLVKDLGFAVVGVPTGPDHITFNLHRVYGPLMYSHLFANWQQVYTDTDINLYVSEKHRKRTYGGGFFHTIHVLRKNRTFFAL
ncbi:hypothetical protein TCAL_15510, partial [Tigriopus californicus]